MDERRAETVVYTGEAEGSLERERRYATRAHSQMVEVAYAPATQSMCRNPRKSDVTENAARAVSKQLGPRMESYTCPKWGHYLDEDAFHGCLHYC
jgi:hypothetical protein